MLSISKRLDAEEQIEYICRVTGVLDRLQKNKYDISQYCGEIKCYVATLPFDFQKEFDSRRSVLCVELQNDIQKYPILIE